MNDQETTAKFAEAYLTYRGRIFSTVLGIIGNVDDAEDIAASAFVRAPPSVILVFGLRTCRLLGESWKGCTNLRKASQRPCKVTTKVTTWPLELSKLNW
jgi:hypothetical protein